MREHWRALSVKMSCLRWIKNTWHSVKFEKYFVGQREDENRTIIDTLEIGWSLLRMLPREELDRVDTKILDEYYDKQGRVLE